MKLTATGFLVVDFHFLTLFFFHLSGCFSCMHVCVSRACSVYRGQKGASDPLARVPEGCEPPSGYWELNPNPLKEQPVFLAIEPFLQPHPLEV